MPEPILRPELFHFLEELQRNNDREWFAENKTRYEREVRDPAVELVRQMQRPLARVAPMLQAKAKGHGGSVMRIYRDTRFSKDKTPYKTNVGISLRHEADGDIHAPGVYIHIAAEECFVGAGCWRPHSRTLGRIRAAIDSDPKGWKRARDNKAFREFFELAGAKLKTSPRDYAKDHPMIEDLRRTDFIGLAPLTRAAMTGDEIVTVLTDRIRRARPLMRFLCEATDVPY